MIWQIKKTTKIKKITYFLLLFYFLKNAIILTRKPCFLSSFGTPILGFFLFEAAALNIKS